MIRHPVSSDIPNIVRLAKERLGSARTPQAYIHVLGQRNILAWVADVDSATCVGYCLGWAAGGVAELTEIAVDGPYEGRGLGRTLVQGFMESARKLGCDEIYLEVRHSNHGAVSLYESAGFRQVGCRENYYPNGDDARLYSLELS